ncbi:hypothetical protein LJR074_002185 [Acidovorax sp. LjRoot74]|uniref:hypothetical protein n=1 Tax=Acidovorax sp. LjRoot74 TaxID=3342337 RepID=UPI003ECEC8C4
MQDIEDVLVVEVGKGNAGSLLTNPSYRFVNATIRMRGGREYLEQLKPGDSFPMGTAGVVLTASFVFPETEFTSCDNQ